MNKCTGYDERPPMEKAYDAVATTARLLMPGLLNLKGQLAHLDYAKERRNDPDTTISDMYGNAEKIERDEIIRAELGALATIMAAGDTCALEDFINRMNFMIEVSSVAAGQQG